MVAALAVAYGVGSVFDLHQQAHILQILDNVLPAFIPVFPFVFAGFPGHLPVQTDDHDLFQVVPLAHFIVVGIMGRGDLHRTGTEFQVHIFIGDDGDFPVGGGQGDFLPHQFPVPFILGIHGHGRIPGDGFRTAGGNGQILVLFAHDGVVDVPQGPCIILVFHFHVGQSRAAVHAPVDHPGSLVDQALFIKAHESFPDSPAQAFIHGEPLPVPVAGNPQALQLADDFVPVGFLPFPDPFHEFFPAQVVAGQAFLLLQFFFHLDLGGQACMVIARQPAGVVPHHPVPAHQDVLEGIVQGMAHVELAGDVGRRDHHTEGFPALVHRLMEKALFGPVCIPFFLHRSRIIDLGDVVFFCHNSASLKK